MNIINEILATTISSGKSEPIKLKQGDKIFSTRSQLHTLIIAPFGFGKSTSLIEIPNKYHYKLDYYTPPAILGSITKQGDFVQGAISKAAGKCLVIDEFHNLPIESRIALLKLLEEQKYSRSLGFKCFRPCKINTKYFKAYVDENCLGIENARFSCICSGLYVGHKKPNDKAFLSRFFPLLITLDLDDAYDLSMGKKPFKITYSDYAETPLFEDYEKFLAVHKEYVKTSPQIEYLTANIGFVRRNIIDWCRIMSFDSRNNGSVTDWEKYLPYIPYSLSAYMLTELTLKELDIYELLIQKKLNQKEISDQLAISENYVSTIKSRLESLKLV